MKRPPIVRGLAFAAAVAAVAVVLGACSNTPESEPGQTDGTEAPFTEIDGGENSYSTRKVTDGTTTFVLVDNPGDGPDLSYGTESGFTLLEETDGDLTYAFKDMNSNGSLDTWEDWRETPQVRAADLAAQLSIEQIAGLMPFTNGQRSVQDGLTDAQKEMMEVSNLRNMLHGSASDADASVTWSNQVQAFAETLATPEKPYVPVNVSSDPRSTAGSGGYNQAGDDISRWPSNLGLAATFNPETMIAHAQMASAEYRALGISTALGPQIDLATEPRWLRVAGTFGEDVDQNTELAAAYVNGMQGSGGEDVWGPESVNAMIKHWAGDGPGEGGREGHSNSGKYGVYPGDNFEAHTQAFLGSLNSAAVMTQYSIALDADGEPLVRDRTGAAYDHGRMGLLRDDAGYDGVVVTDWGVMTALSDEGASFGAAWGAEHLTPTERYVEVLSTGHDMFGGVNDSTLILESFDLWQEKFEAGELEIDAETRFRESGTRILTMIFHPGLFESAFLDLDESKSILASEDKVAAGYQAQLDSVVLIKNDDTIVASDAEDWKDKTVYIPRAYNSGFDGAFGPGTYVEDATISIDVAKQYFGTVLTDEMELEEPDENGVQRVISYTAPDLSDVDLVLVGMPSPDNGTLFSNAGHHLVKDEDGNVTEEHWYPFSLQYRPYTADGPNVRQTSIGGDILEDGTKENRSYYGNTSQISNESVLDAFERALEGVAATGNDIPIIAVVKAINPVILTEFEPQSDAIVVGFGTSDQALIEVALGLFEPKGRLPIQFPVDMDTVEAQLEDVAKDMTPYTDSAGNEYDYGFGLNYSGPITD